MGKCLGGNKGLIGATALFYVFYNYIALWLLLILLLSWSLFSYLSLSFLLCLPLCAPVVMDAKCH